MQNVVFFFSSRRRHTRCSRDWSSDVCSSDLERARRQVAHELEIIGRLDLAGYFLIVWDIVQFCRGNEVLVQGRGSAANSARSEERRVGKEGRSRWSPDH